MFFRQGFKFVFRDKKSILFLLLAFLSVLLTAASLCTGIALNSALAACKDSYITIGTVEYTGAEYPDDSYIDENVAEIVESFSPEIKNGVISYTKTENALGMLDEMTDYVGKDRSKNNAVFAVKVIRKSEWDDSVFVPESAGVKTETLSFTIGQFRFENGKGEEYLENLVLPENIRVTLFDHGYGRASAALNDMAMLVSSVCRICLGAGGVC